MQQLIVTHVVRSVAGKGQAHQAIEHVDGRHAQTDGVVGQTQCLLDQDYLEILLANLNDRNESYREVATVTNIDLQNLPAVLPTEPPTPVFVSITDRDVILAHRFVATSNPVTQPVRDQ